MLNSEKKIRAWRDKKKNILTLVLSEIKILNKTKNHNPPLFKLNGRSLMKLHLCTSQVTCTRVNKILGVDTQYTAKVKNL